MIARRKTRRGPRGFTLIEILITVVAVAILSAIAFPSYQAHVAKGRRADGKAAIMALAQVMERWYTERGTYAGATVGSSGLMASSSERGYYTLSITAQDASGYTIRATPAGAQSSDACGSYTYTQAGTRGVTGGSKSASECW